MIEFRNALSDIVEEFGTDDGGFQVRQRAAFIRFRYGVRVSVPLSFQFRFRPFRPGIKTLNKEKIKASTFDEEMVLA